jgi:hypothetical protein
MPELSSGRPSPGHSPRDHAHPHLPPNPSSPKKKVFSTYYAKGTTFGPPPDNFAANFASPRRGSAERKQVPGRPPGIPALNLSNPNCSTAFNAPEEPHPHCQPHSLKEGSHFVSPAAMSRANAVVAAPVKVEGKAGKKNDNKRTNNNENTNNENTTNNKNPTNTQDFNQDSPEDNPQKEEEFKKEEFTLSNEIDPFAHKRQKYASGRNFDIADEIYAAKVAHFDEMIKIRDKKAKEREKKAKEMAMRMRGKKSFAGNLIKNATKELEREEAGGGKV